MLKPSKKKEWGHYMPYSDDLLKNIDLLKKYWFFYQTMLVVVLVQHSPKNIPIKIPMNFGIK